MAIEVSLAPAYHFRNEGEARIPLLSSRKLTIEFIRSHSVLYMHRAASVRLLGSTVLSIQYR